MPFLTQVKLATVSPESMHDIPTDFGSTLYVLNLHWKKRNQTPESSEKIHDPWISRLEVLSYIVQEALWCACSARSNLN